MEFHWLIINFLILTFIVSGVIIFFLHRTLISSTEGAVKRLNEEIAKANTKQIELSRKLKEADEELAKRQAEARDLANKMKSDAEAESKAEREKIVAKARAEGEEIIAKAQNTKDKLKQEIEKELDIRVIHYSMEILNTVLSQKAQSVLEDILLNEFLENLQHVDMSKINVEAKSADVITLRPIDDKTKNRVAQVIKDKLKRDIAINAVADPKIGGGVILKFGSLALDGSIQNLIRETGITLQQKISER